MFVNNFVIFNLSIISLLNICLLSEEFIKVDFNTSMEPSIRQNIYYQPEFSLKNSAWKLARKFYEKNILKPVDSSYIIRIPKKIHQIWLGSPVPEHLKVLQKTWEKKHPGWEYNLWTDKDIEAFRLYNKKFYDQANNYGEKADIARYEILYRLGGLYIDMDFECIQPFDLLHYNLDFYVGIEFCKDLRANNALIGARVGHPILKDCIEKMGQYQPENINNFLESVVQRTGPAFFTRMILLNKELFNKERIVLFPNTFFYPFNAKENLTRDEYIKPETLAVHYWNMSWVK